MSFRTLFRIFSILIAIYCLQIISVVNGLNESEADDINNSNAVALPTYDINSENQPTTRINPAHYPQKVDTESIPLLPTTNIDPKNLLVAIPALKTFAAQKRLQSVVPSKKIAIFKPNHQLQAGDDKYIEEISTNDLPDEYTFNLNRKLSELLKMFTKNYYQQTNSNNFPTGKTNAMSVSTNFNQKVPDNIQNQHVRVPPKIKIDPAALPLLQMLLSNNQILKSLFPNMGHSVDYSDSIKALTKKEHSSKDNTATEHKNYSFLNPLYFKIKKNDDQNEAEPLLSSSGAASSAVPSEDQPTLYSNPNQQNVQSSEDIDDIVTQHQSYAFSNPLYFKSKKNDNQNEAVPLLSSSGVASAAVPSEDQPTVLEMLDPLYQKLPTIDPASLYSNPNEENVESSDDTAASHQNYDASIPSHSKPDENDVENETDPLKKFKQTVKTDIDAIVEQFKEFVPSSDDPVFMEHYQRANAFLTCCQLDKKTDKNLLKKFVDAYGLLAKQMSIIKGCATTLLNSDKKRCDISFAKLTRARGITMRIAHLFSNNNSTKNEDPMQLLDKAIQPSVDAENIVYDYGSATHKICEPALLLLWEPAELIRCETEYRLIMFDNLTACEEYDNFNKEISVPFQQKALNLRVPLQNAWKKVDHQVNQNILAKADNMLVLEDQINSDIDKIRNKLSIYSTHLQHPMIAHHAKRAHAYKVCCGPSETPSQFNEYMANFDYDFKQGHAMDKLLTKCVRQQTLQLIDDTTVDNECSAAYNDLTDAMRERQNFINKYGKQNPDMIKDFRQATRLKKGQLPVIQDMAVFVKHYCPDQHIFEIMFDFNKNINCERLIRHAIDKDSKTYSVYNILTSDRFQDLIQQDWDQLTQVLADIKTDDDTAFSVVAQAPEIKPPRLHSSPKKQGEFMSLASDASSTMMVVSQCFSVLFMFIIQILFF